VPGLRSSCAALDGAEGFRGEQEEGGDQGEGSGDGYSDDAEGEQDKPDERIEEECDEGERPAEDQQDAEEEEFEHVCLPGRIGGCVRVLASGALTCGSGALPVQV
jgi:hypothetical protein